MSVPIAVVGWIPKIRISSGVISDPPPMPVMPTSTPMPNPKRTIAGSMGSCAAPRGVLIDFPDLLGQERGVRQDTKNVRLDSRPRPLLRRAAPDRAARSRGRRARGGRSRRALGLRQVDAAGADLRAARPGLGHDRGRRRRDRQRGAALANRGPRQGGGGERGRELFGRFGLAGFESAAPAELSGGMRQRVAFLRTLIAGKPLLALDEPFAALDALTRAAMQGWLAAALEADPRTVVLVSHDVEEALYLSDRVLVLSARPARIVAELDAPAARAPDRDAAVTAPDFVAVREQAKRALHEGAR